MTKELLIGDRFVDRALGHDLWSSSFPKASALCWSSNPVSDRFPVGTTPPTVRSALLSRKKSLSWRVIPVIPGKGFPVRPPVQPR